MEIITIDVDKLRNDLTKNYGTAMFIGFPVAMMDLQYIESMPDYELCEYAQRNGLDLRKYQL